MEYLTRLLPSIRQLILRRCFLKIIGRCLIIWLLFSHWKRDLSKLFCHSTIDRSHPPGMVDSCPLCSAAAPEKEASSLPHGSDSEQAQMEVYFWLLLLVASPQSPPFTVSPPRCSVFDYSCLAGWSLSDYSRCLVLSCNRGLADLCEDLFFVFGRGLSWGLICV